MHTDLYKVNLRSLSEGDHELHWVLGDDYFQHLGAEDFTSGEVYVDVYIHHIGGVFSLELEYDGYVGTTCDRCLDPLELDVYTERELVVKFGDEHREESEKLLIIPEQDGVLDLTWTMYEDVVLSLPMQRMHEEGECNEDMMRAYSKVAADEPQPQQQEIIRDEDGIDERWAALKQLKQE